MPRKSRIDAAGALHHIMVRGIEKGKVFRSDGDRNHFLDRLGEILQDTETSCYAWALIPNHFHLLLRSGSVPISTEKRKECRNITIYLLKKYVPVTDQQIGELLGNISYSAVAKAHSRFSERIPKDRSLKKTIREITTGMSNVKV